MSTDLLFPELSFKIIGCAFAVHNELGGGLPEAVYQKALEVVFEIQNIAFAEQQFSNLLYKGRKIKRNYSDLLVEDLIIVELKSTYRIIGSDFGQIEKRLEIYQQTIRYHHSFRPPICHSQKSAEFVLKTILFVFLNPYIRTN